MSHPTQTKRIIWQGIKWGVFLLVLGFVAWHGWTLWNKLGAVPTHLNWGWLALAAVGTGFVWIPSVWYWRWIMNWLGATPPWPQTLRSYYSGALGKYLPGKAAVIVLRAAMLKRVGVPAATAGLAVTHETLTCMWAGGISVILLYPRLAEHLPDWISVHGDQPWLRYPFLAASVVGGAFALAMLVRSHRMLRGLLKNTEAGLGDASLALEGTTSVPASSENGTAVPSSAVVAAGPVHLSMGDALRMTLCGGVACLAEWWIHGLTLGFTIYAVVGNRADWSDWPFWTAAAAVSLVGGFAVLFAPGGLGVREGLLLELLERLFEPREAVLITILWRGASLVGEIVAAGALYYGIPASRRPPRAAGQPQHT
jgi:uncharacterized membrane protein YbhN (UPF0104 family)